MIQKARNSNYFLAGIVSLVTFLVYLPSLQNEFVNWDDPKYVFENSNITSFDIPLFKWAFFHFYAANWHPLTWISHALDYAIWRLNPVGHHLTNNIIHAINSFLVVVLIIKLLEIHKERVIRDASTTFIDRPAMLMVGGITGLLFGLHPVHVESVAWVAERKDLLCALFFLLSIMVYAEYAKFVDKETVQEKMPPRFLNRDYLFSLCFFILALLSKSMAVSLPVVLLILDWYPFKRIHSVKHFWSIFIEKIPFLSLSFISSILTILAQKSGGAVKPLEFIPLSTRMLVAAKSFIVYLGNMILPIDLIPYYPYPKNSSLFSLEYLSAIVLVVGITTACVVMTKKKKLWLSVWVYYVVTLIPVIGIIQVGGQSMADRYAYLPSLGPFLLMGVAIAWSWSRANALRRKSATLKLCGISAFVFLSTALIYLTFKQMGIWKDSITLWSYVIEKEPESVYFAYYNRACAFGKMGKFDKAIEDYSKSIALNQNNSQAFVNRGLIYLDLDLVQLASADLNRACELGELFGCTAARYLKK
ncbi:MAG TPA: hypothetical protein DCP92_10115 [Nitrospiraceae bacterium]|jgi:energy-converting hydrogenase Eha subunit A|nr:hypothetical protein [Nitrospiraceae bacterium]